MPARATASALRVTTTSGAEDTGDAGAVPSAAHEAATLRAPPEQPSRLARQPTSTLLDWAVALISLKLEQLERTMTSDLDSQARGDTHTAADHEREARTIGALIDNLDKITEMEAGPRTKGAAQPAVDLAGEAERHRREFAERLGKIVDALAGDKT